MHAGTQNFLQLSGLCSVFLGRPHAWLNPTIQISELALNSWLSSTRQSYTKSILVTLEIHVHKPQWTQNMAQAILPPFCDLGTLLLQSSFKLFSLCSPLIHCTSASADDCFLLPKKKWPLDCNSFIFLAPKIKFTSISLSVIYRSVLTTKVSPSACAMKVPSPLVFSMTFINYPPTSHIFNLSS